MLVVAGMIAGSVVKFALSLAVAYIAAWMATGNLDKPY